MYCECGCGKMTRISDRGKLNRFVRYHHKATKESRKRNALELLIETDGYCECGCGKMTKVNEKGRNNRFLRHHSPACQKGKTVSKETIQKMCISQKGNKNALGCKRSEETRKKLSIAHTVRTGSRSPNWRGGASFEPYPISFNSELKRTIKSRDNHQCQNPGCWKTASRIAVHHIDYDKKNCSPENLITVCTSCNSRANKGREFWIALYRKIVDTKPKNNLLKKIYL